MLQSMPSAVYSSTAARLGEGEPTSANNNTSANGLRGRDLDRLEKARHNDPTGKLSLRIVICSENWLPKVDGVTRTIAKLLEHLQAEGHEAMIMGPNSSSMKEYAGAEVVGTEGVPLVGVYSGLALNFMRPRFVRKIREFKPDVIQFVDPIWLCAQAIPVIQHYFPDIPLVASYHTNLASYSRLFGFSWLTPTVWRLQRNLHSRCKITFCPSPSTQRMLEEQGFRNVKLWPRGVYTTLFRPEARDHSLRRTWGAEPSGPDISGVVAETFSNDSRRSSLELASPPPASFPQAKQSKVVMLYVGRISWEKNLRLLVEAFRGLQLASADGLRPACQLVFVGDGPSRPELESLCASYNLDAVFMGYRKGEELAAAFASADIFAFPSWTETFGQVVLESLASGLPVVGLRAEGVCDLVQDGETGLLLDMDDLLPSATADAVFASAARPPPPYSATPNPHFKPLPADPNSLVGEHSTTFPLAVSLYRSLLVELATDHARRESMSQAAVTFARSKSWHSAMKMIVDGYREVVRTPPPTPLVKPEYDLTLSRTPTLDLDAEEEDDELSTEREATAATEPGATTARSRRRRKLLRFGGVFKRKSVAQDRTFASWLGSKPATVENGARISESDSPQVLLGKENSYSQFWAISWVLRLLLLTYVTYLLSTWVVRLEPIAAIVA